MKDQFLSIMGEDAEPLHIQLGNMANQAVDENRAADGVLLNAYANRQNIRAERDKLEASEKRIAELEIIADNAIKELSQNPLCTISGWEDKEGLVVVRLK